jgi:Family of unknown function (DUF5755)
MGKKCIPGLFCIENMTLFLLVFGILLLGYIYSMQKIKFSPSSPQIIVVRDNDPGQSISNLGIHLSSRNDSFHDPYSPPLKNDPLFYPPILTSDIRPVPGIPINIETRGVAMGYQQIGILVPAQAPHLGNKMILPLMGRRSMTGRDKWQYYTISNSGTINAKLPIRKDGKSCTSEYGCDPLYDGDTVYVDGYNETFRATIYENNLFQYIPY